MLVSYQFTNVQINIVRDIIQYSRVIAPFLLSNGNATIGVADGSLFDDMAVGLLIVVAFKLSLLLYDCSVIC